MSSANHHVVYVLGVDINGFSKLLDAQQKRLLLLLNQEHVKIRNKVFEKDRLDYFSSTGDGFMYVFSKTSKGEETENKTTVKTQLFFDYVLNLHMSLRAELKKLVKNEEYADHRCPSIRMGVNYGSAYYVKADENKNSFFTGSALNNCQRVMDFGIGWHLLLSEEVVHTLVPYLSYNTIREVNSYKPETIHEGVFKFKRWCFGRDSSIHNDEQPDALCDIKARSCGSFSDKHGQKLRIWSVLSSDSDDANCELVGYEESPPRWPKHAVVTLRTEDLNYFTKLFSDSLGNERIQAFRSVTLTHPKSWLSDPTLMSVLTKQAFYKGKFERGEDKKLEFVRYGIWEDLNTQSVQTLRLAHENAYVDLKAVDLNLLVEELEHNNPFVELEEKLNALPPQIKKVFSRFTKYPLREFWAVYIDKENNEIKESGYGVDDDFDGRYDSLQMFPQDDLTNEILDVWFKLLDSCHSR